MFSPVMFGDLALSSINQNSPTTIKVTKAIKQGATNSVKPGTYTVPAEDIQVVPVNGDNVSRQLRVRFPGNHTYTAFDITGDTAKGSITSPND